MTANELASVLTNLGPAVRSVRKARGLTQPMAAWQMGVGESTLRRIEKGCGTSFYGPTLMVILRWLGDDLVTLNG